MRLKHATFLITGGASGNDFELARDNRLIIAGGRPEALDAAQADLPILDPPVESAMTRADRRTRSPRSWLRRLGRQGSSLSGASPHVRPGRHRLRAFYHHMGLWTLQAWLAMFFVGAAYAKLSQSPEMLTHLLGWSDGVDPMLVRAVGVAELVLAVGVLAPLLTWRGGGQVMAFAVVGMIGLTAFTLALHLSRLELGFATLNLVLAGLALVVLMGRLRDARVSL